MSQPVTSQELHRAAPNSIKENERLITTFGLARVVLSHAHKMLRQCNHYVTNCQLRTV